MTLFALLAVLLPWSLWRQTRPHEVTRSGLVKLPLTFAAIGLLASGTKALPAGAAGAELAASLLVSVAFGALRGALMPTWQDGAGSWMSRGNATTIGLWAALIAVKFVIGAVAETTGALPSETVGEIFLFLGLSFAVQNLVVARRTLLVPAAAPEPA